MAAFSVGEWGTAGQGPMIYGGHLLNPSITSCKDNTVTDGPIQFLDHLFWGLSLRVLRGTAFLGFSYVGIIIAVLDQALTPTPGLEWTRQRQSCSQRA